MPSRGGIQPGRSFELDGRHVRLRIYPNGTGTATFAQTGGVTSVARTGVGTFLVTLQDAYKVLASMNATMQTTAASPLMAQFGDISNVGTSSAVTVVVRMYDTNAAGVADLAADPDNSITVDLCFEASQSNNAATYA
jgi:hypothetical protein